MYRFNSPEDNTSVIRMVKDFHRFLNKSPPKTRRDESDFNFSCKSSLFGDNSSSKTFNLLDDVHNSCSSSKINKRSSLDMPEDNATRKRRLITTLSIDEKAELIASKSKTAHLEVQLKSLDYERRRSDIEIDKKRKLQANKFAKDQEEIDVLRRKYKELVEQKQVAVDDLATFEKMHKEMKTELNSKIDEMHKDNFFIKNSLEEIQCGNNSDFDEVNEKYRKTNIELDMCKEMLEEAEIQLNMERSRIEESKELVSDYTELQSRCELAEGKVKYLEQKLLQVDETYLVVQRSQKQLVEYHQLEKDNKALREDNALYRDSSSNVAILEEKLSNLMPQVTRAKELKEKVEELKYGNDELMKKIEMWEAPVAYGSNRKARSPADLTRIISQLQTSELNLTATNTQWEMRAVITDSMMESNKNEWVEMLNKLRVITVHNEQLEDKKQKLQRRLTLLTTERDGLRRVLSSYEKEEATALSIHMQQGEQMDTQYNQQLKLLEDDLSCARMEVVRQKTMYLEIQQEQKSLKEAEQASIVNIKAMVEAETTKEQLRELTAKYEKLAEENEILELRIEKREMQGDYDPFKTKVLQLKYNPHQAKREARLNEIKETFEENERMRKKLIKLQAARDEEAEESMNVSRLIKSSKPMEEAHKQAQEWKHRYKRLEQEFGKTAKKIMQAITNLFGYTLKEDKDDTYRLGSIYSENPDNFFIVCCSQTKDAVNTRVIETEFMRQWVKQFDKYVRRRDSIPLFLAAVNLELFEQANESIVSPDCISTLVLPDDTLT